MRVLGSRSLSYNKRMHQNWYFVISRLTFIVHVWSTFTGQPRKILNRTYMRTWRRIAGDPRHSRTTWTDCQVRIRLNVPSLDCLIRKRRLVYLARLAGAKFDALHAALQCRDKSNNPLPWIRLITADIAVLRSRVPAMHKYPDPADNYSRALRLTRRHM